MSLSLVVWVVVAGVLGALAPYALSKHPAPLVPEDMEPVYYSHFVAERPRLAWQCSLASALIAIPVAYRLRELQGPLWYLVPLIAVGVPCAVVDYHTRTLPRWIVNGLGLWVLGITATLSFVYHNPTALLFAIVCGALLWAFFGVSWYFFNTPGFGDVRLSLPLGMALAFLGPGTFFVGVFAMFVLGGLGMLVLTKVGPHRGRRQAFGPFMVLGTLVGVIWGDVLFRWYLTSGAG